MLDHIINSGIDWTNANVVMHSICEKLIILLQLKWNMVNLVRILWYLVHRTFNIVA